MNGRFLVFGRAVVPISAFAVLRMIRRHCGTWRARDRRRTGSQLFTAHDVKNHLSVDASLNKTIDWCERMTVMHIY
jgi:hypothetical protein